IMPEESFRAALTDSEVLAQMATGIVVTDPDCMLLYANSFAVSLFGFPDDPAHLVGRSLLSLGIEQGDVTTVQHLAEDVLSGWPWEGTLATQRLDGSRGFGSPRARPPCRPA